MKQIVLASNNRGKLAELQAMFAPLGVDLVRQADLGIGEAEEPFHTFVENALAKARHAARHSGLPAVADDAGLCVDAFGGLPGVQTAYYATQFGLPKGDDHNVTALLQGLGHVFVKTIASNGHFANGIHHLSSLGHFAKDRIAPPLAAGGCVIQKVVVDHVDEKLGCG